ncbi:hypothetical protein RRG08_055098 [Elysia crispata]|uniref:Uncharacterized protein n=1 Tax=Elysia crispata TaxID=231223 RepID=A0AAE1DHV9_9GAST|nr:hypothetical protein RRG08_055098 [Elysia crispata]
MTQKIHPSLRHHPHRRHRSLCPTSLPLTFRRNQLGRSFSRKEVSKSSEKSGASPGKDLKTPSSQKSEKKTSDSGNKTSTWVSGFWVVKSFLKIFTVIFIFPSTSSISSKSGTASIVIRLQGSDNTSKPPEVKQSSRRQKTNVAAKKTVTQEKSAARLGTKSDESITSQSIGSSSSRTAENTSALRAKRDGEEEEERERASQVTDTSRDVTDTTANGNKSDSGVKSTPSPLTTAARSVSENKSKKPSDLSVDATAVGSKSDSSVKSTPSPLTGTSRNLSENKSKKPEKDLQPPSSTNLEASTPSKSEKVFKHGPDGGNSSPAHEGQGKRGESEEQRKLEKELKRREAELLAVKQRLAEMEERVKHLEAEKDEKAQDETKDGKTESKDEDKTSGDNQPKNQGDEAQHISHKRDLDTVSEKLGELQARLEEKESQCERLMSDNHGLKERLKSSPQGDKGDGGKSEKDKDLAVLEHDLEAAERELEETREDNRELKRQVMEMRNEMDEMTDSFRESELEEFREMQRELEMASKNCRILQFKLRKSERKNIQTEEDRANYEEKLRQLEAQFDSQDARNHIQVLEEELRLAKEVSVRLHDELDIVEDKRLKAMEENRHLTELLEHTDKRQFRMEMEIDKLRDMVCDLKQQLKEANAGEGTRNAQDSSDRKVISSIYTRSVD